MLPEKREARKAVGAAPSLDSEDNMPNPSTPTDKRKQARRAGTYRYEEGGRFLYRYGANGVTVFDLAKLGTWTPARGGRI